MYVKFHDIIRWQTKLSKSLGCERRNDYPTLFWLYFALLMALFRWFDLWAPCSWKASDLGVLMCYILRVVTFGVYVDLVQRHWHALRDFQSLPILIIAMYELSEIWHYDQSPCRVADEKWKAISINPSEVSHHLVCLLNNKTSSQSVM